MGIQGLSKLLADIAPSGMKENEIKNYFGKYLLKVSEFFLV
jgi:flap endonuclease-1